MIDNVTIKAPKKAPTLQLSWGNLKAGQVVETDTGALVLVVADTDRSTGFVLIAKDVKDDGDAEDSTRTAPYIVRNPMPGRLKRILPEGTRITLTIEAE